MRRIGTLPDKTSAKKFADFLYTESVETKLLAADGDQWDVWARDEKDVDKARSVLAEFVASPNADRFNATDQANQLRDDRIRRESDRIAKLRQAASDSSTASGTTGPASRAASSGPPTQSRHPSELVRRSLGGRVRQQSFPVTIAVIVISVIVSFTTNFGKPRGSAKPGEVTIEQRVYRMLSFAERQDFAQSDNDPYVSIRKGQVWRLFTPMFLHGDEFHVAFNMLWIFFLGSVIERLHGSLFFTLLLLVTQFAGMMLQVSLPPLDWLPVSMHGTPFAIGASGAVYGLFGYLWIRPTLDLTYPISLDPINVVLMLGWLVVCMTPYIPNVANGAHLGGLIAGVIAAVISYFATGKFAKR
ncbi:MAG: rhomboid family intramembrane serine protease [Rubripirellula sp.]